MSNSCGFLDYSRKTRSRRPVRERVKDFKEIEVGLNEENIKKQAIRCMDCGVPFCHGSGCPLSSLIPEFNGLVSIGNLEEAWRRLQEINPMPEITARVCPAPCEWACTLSLGFEGVSIRDIELFIAEEAFRRGLLVPSKAEQDTGKKVAIIGSGPAALAAVSILRQKGYSVTVFEKAPLAGGMLRFGIPDFKLDKEVLDRRIKIMKKEGVSFKTSTEAGKDISAEELEKRFDAVLMATGARVPRDLKIPGRELNGIYFAMDYLGGVNEYIAGLKKEKDIISAKGKKVLVLGGSDTGNDCASTAVRQGAKKVFQADIVPRPPEGSGRLNPSWPLTPRINKTSPSDEEGARRLWSVQAEKFRGGGGKVRKTEFIKVKWNSDGTAFKKEAGSSFGIDTDIVVLAMGFLHTSHKGIVKDFRLESDERGNIKTDQCAMSSREGVFAAGDAKSGASLVVSALQCGKQAALSIDQYIKSGKSRINQK